MNRLISINFKILKGKKVKYHFYLFDLFVTVNNVGL